MANIRIADLPPVPSLANNAIIVLEQNGISYHTSISDLFTDSLPDAAFGNTTVTGDLTVNGLSTLDDVNMTGSFLTLNSGVTGSPTASAMFRVNRGTSPDVALIWDEANDYWDFGIQNVEANTFIGNLTGNVTGDVTGNLTGNVTGDVTGSVTGTVSSLANHDTGDLSEGPNLYFTNSRADARVNSVVTKSYIEGLQPKASPVPAIQELSSRSLVLSDASTSIVYYVASPKTLTVPTNASVSFQNGTTINVVQRGSAATTIASATGVSVLNVDGFYRTAGIGAVASLYKVASDVWVLTGALQP